MSTLSGDGHLLVTLLGSNRIFSPKGVRARAVLALSIWALSPCTPGSPSTPTLAEIASGAVEIVDLTHALDEKNPYWPGEAYHPFHFETIATLEEDGVYSGAFSTPEHLGTHVDAPNHFEPDQLSVDELLLQNLVAPMVVVDVRRACQKDADYRLLPQDLQSWEEQHGRIPAGAVVFGLTGWGAYWDDHARYKNQSLSGRLHFPGFSREAAHFLVKERAIKGLGIDTLSVDYGLSTDFVVHHIVNGAGAYHIENATNLDKIPACGAWMVAAPIKIKQGSGGPSRVWAIFDS